MSDDKNNAQPAGLLREALQARFGETFAVDENLSGLDELARMANRRVLRRFTDRAVDPALLRMLCACALSAPSKSDLQQAEILIVKDPARRSVINELLKDQAWVSSAPVLLVFLANGRRIVEIAKKCEKPFPNDHLDLFFNASVDAGIVLATFLRAAEIYGERFAGPSGRVMASFEVLFLHGWAPHASQPKPLKPGSAALRLSEALGTAEYSAGEKVERS